VGASPLPIDIVMSKLLNFRSATGRQIAWLTGIACVACCAVPLVGLALGSAAVAGLAVYSERAAIAVALVGAAALVLRRLARRSGPSCDVNGPCKPVARGVSAAQKDQ
jgi:hypothetical protein